MVGVWWTDFCSTYTLKKILLGLIVNYLYKECDGETGADVSCTPDPSGETQQSRCDRTPGAASPSCAAADAAEADPLSEQARCVCTSDATSPSSAAADATGADHLPEAIAPSLAATPEFARRNTSWCHAIEVRFVLVSF